MSGDAPKHIVAVIGTKGAFLRLTSALADYARAHPEAELWLQHGEGPLPGGLPNLTGAPLIRREELLAKLDAADAVICHGGSGTLRDALALGHVPIVVPRRASFGEHVNDHQLELVDALGGRILAVTEPDADTLGRAVTQAASRRGPPGTDRGEALKSALRADLAALTRETPARRGPLTQLLRLGTWWVPRRSHRWEP